MDVLPYLEIAESFFPRLDNGDHKHYFCRAWLAMTATSHESILAKASALFFLLIPMHLFP
ncbi:MAG: hypothetical protein D6816_08855 [Bacteroidetes bacterium]|jgi:hypothetical protein|nr:hypothetical protein [Saprospirales bacterium]RME05455.1 MAG: hypothetical protein D6816_08855 [Bacteroidota bacterium]